MSGDFGARRDGGQASCARGNNLEVKKQICVRSPRRQPHELIDSIVFESLRGEDISEGETVVMMVKEMKADRVVRGSAAANRFQIDLKNRIELNRSRYIDLTNSESICCRGRHSLKEMLI